MKVLNLECRFACEAQPQNPNERIRNCVELRILIVSQQNARNSKQRKYMKQNKTQRALARREYASQLSQLNARALIAATPDWRPEVSAKRTQAQHLNFKI